MDVSGGGVPGGVLEGGLLLGCGVSCRGGIHAKHSLEGLGPKFIPLHFEHGGVGGGVHVDDPLQGMGQSGDVVAIDLEDERVRCA